MTTSPQRLRILIVDDESHSLNALRRRLHGFQERWDVRFSSDSREALEQVKSDHVDVVVADLHMPPLHGDSLLEQVRVAAPRVVRILMTVATDVDPIVTSASVAHRFLAKPFEGEELEQLIECASLLRDIPIPSALAEVIGSVVKGPLFPVHYAELIDPLYCVTRSPDLRPARVLAARLFEQLRVPSAIDPNPLWALGCESAEWALHICECERLSARMRAHAVVASLLHPLGAMLVARYAPESGCADDEAHLKDPELHHASVASYTLALWGFPNEVVEAVAFHLVPDRNQPSVLGAITVTHTACAIACSLRKGDSPTSAVDLQHLERLGLKRRLVSWLETHSH